MRKIRWVPVLSDFESCRILGLCESGLSLRKVSRRMNRSLRTMVPCEQAWKEGWWHRPSGSGRRGTTKYQDSLIRLFDLSDRFTETRPIGYQWFQEHSRMVGMRTVYGRKHNLGLCSYRPLWVLLLTSEQGREGLLRSRERIQWNHKWNRVTFSNESLFCLWMRDGRAMIRQRRGERRDTVRKYSSRFHTFIAPTMLHLYYR